MGIDAGESTGLTVWDFEDETFYVLAGYQFKAGSEVANAEQIDTLYSRFTPDVVVAEQFDLRPGNEFVADLSTVGVNNIIKWLHAWEWTCDLVWQTPGQAKGLVKDKILKRLDFWPTGKLVGQKDANDVRDAARHTVYYAVMTLKHRPTIEAGWPNA